MSTSLRAALNSIVDDRRLQEDLSADDPSIPPAPTGVNAATPKRTAGSGCGFANVALSPPGLETLNTYSGGNPNWVVQSQTSAGNYPKQQSSGPSRTRIGGVELSGTGNGSLQYPNPNGPS